MIFKGASSDPEPVKKLSADQGAAILANTNAEIVFAAPGSGMSNTLNVMAMGSEIERLSLLARMAEVELSPAQQEIGVAIIKALPAGATIRDFLEACRLDNAKRLGCSPEMLDAIAPLLAALEEFQQKITIIDVGPAHRGLYHVLRDAEKAK